MKAHRKSLKNLPLSRLIMASIILVSLLPLVLLGPQIHQTIWDNAQREVTEKHLLIAQNLAEPLRLFINTHQNSLQMLADTFQQFGQTQQNKYKTLLKKSIAQPDHHFNALSLIDLDGRLIISSIKPGLQPETLPNYGHHLCFIKTLDSSEKMISETHLSLITNEPTIELGQPIFDINNELVAVLLAEIDLQPIKDIRAKVRFGKLGHGAIVDSKGQALAHPNQEWNAQIKDLSHWPIVKKMMAGETGVMEFYSSHIKSDMVAGYAGIKGLGWGVMVPQPKSEIEALVAAILNSLILWSIVGMLIAIAAAYLLSRWISQPINQLARNAKQINDKKDTLNLVTSVQPAPCEVVEMANAMQTLMTGLQASNQEISDLNGSLQDEINQATTDLQSANDNLQQLASSDHLTAIANRRFFESTVTDILGHKPGKSIGIMLMDIDNFKDINDQYSHAAGDYVLTMVAKLLEKATRPGDIIARYGGDEFVAEFETDVKTIQKRAEDLRHTIENYPFIWQGHTLYVTLSIGIICHKTTADSNLHQLMTGADGAMYKAKKAGRNKIAIVKN